MKPQQFLEEIIDPTLEYMSKYNPLFKSRAARALLLGTALAESNLDYLRQVKGPAISVYQIEPATLKDLFRWTKASPYYNMVTASMTENPNIEQELIYNLRFATIMARLYYFRKPGVIPATLDGIAQYWKTHYNTRLGKGTVEGFKKKAEFIKTII
jgi:hypothetical protein